MEKLERQQGEGVGRGDRRGENEGARSGLEKQRKKAFLKKKPDSFHTQVAIRVIVIIVERRKNWSGQRRCGGSESVAMRDVNDRKIEILQRQEGETKVTKLRRI